MSKKLFRFYVLAFVISSFLCRPALSAAYHEEPIQCSVRDHYCDHFGQHKETDWSYPSLTTIWHKALSPHNIDASAVIEGRVFSFTSSGSSRTGKAYDAAYPLFERAISVLKRHIYQKQNFGSDPSAEEYDDLTHCYVNIGIFHYLRGQTGEAEQYLKTALSTARKYSNKYSIPVGEIVEYRAVINRSNLNFSKARSDYTRVQKIYDNADDSSSESNHIKPHALMSHLDNRDETAAFAFYQDNGKPAVIRPNMPTVAGEDVFKKMVAFAKYIIDKYKYEAPPPVVPSQLGKTKIVSREGLATIVGTWHIDTDLITTVTEETSSTSRETIQGAESRKSSGSKSSRLADVPIYLFRLSDYGKLISGISSFASRHGLSMENFSKTWPATHKQADDLLLEIKSIAATSCVPGGEVQTDHHGDYEISNIPKGKYFLYAGLSTEYECRMWFSPSLDKPIVVTKREQFPVNFQKTDGQLIWFDSSVRPKSRF